MKHLLNGGLSYEAALRALQLRRLHGFDSADTATAGIRSAEG